MKNIIIYKILFKHKSIIPILLIGSVGMAFVHNQMDNQLLIILIWSFILSGILLVFHHKNLIKWQQKSLVRKLKESVLVFLYSYIALLTPSPFSILVGIVLFIVLLYLVSSVTESGEDITPLVKNNMSKNKLSEDERENFIIKQKLNYPEPDSEMELAIIQNELKIKEVIQLKEDLEGNISKKEKEIRRMKEELEKSKDYKYTESLKDNIKQVETEKSKLVEKREDLIKAKHQLEEHLKIQQIKFEQQQLKTEELEKEKIRLKEDLTEKERRINEERSKKQYLELEQERIKKILEERYKEIDELNKKKNQLEETKRNYRKQIDNINEELNRTRKTQEDYRRKLDSVQRVNKELEENFQKEKMKVDLQLQKLRNQKESVEREYDLAHKRLNQAEEENKTYYNEKATLSIEIQELQKQLEDLSQKQQADLKEKQQRLLEVKAIIKDKENREHEYKLQLEEIQKENDRIKGEYETYKESKDKDLQEFKRNIEEQIANKNVLRDQLKEYERSFKVQQLDKSKLETEVNHLYEKIRLQNTDITGYVREMEETGRVKHGLEQQFERNKEILRSLSNTIEEYKQKYELKNKELLQKERELAGLNIEKETQKQKVENLNKENEKLIQDIKDFDNMLSNNDEQYWELESKKREIIDKENIINALYQELNGLKVEKKKQNEHFEDLKKHQSIIYLPKESKSEKQLIVRRMRELYPNLTFDNHFFNQIKSVGYLEQIEVEKNLLLLNYLPHKVKYRDNRILVPKGPAVSEIMYDIKDQKGAGKGRIYVRNNHVLTISRTPKEQGIIIKRIKNGQFETINK